MVEERTEDLAKAQEDLLSLNRGLEKTVNDQVKELKNTVN